MHMKSLYVGETWLALTQGRKQQLYETPGVVQRKATIIYNVYINMKTSGDRNNTVYRGRQ